MKWLFILFAFFSASAHATGYVCESTNRDLVARVFEDKIQSGQAVMILSNPRLSEGNRLIARFVKVEGFTTNDTATYQAQPSLDARPVHWDPEETVSGVPLQDVSLFRLVVEFAWGRPRLNGEYVPGKILITTVKNEIKEVLIDCYFYSKD